MEVSRSNGAENRTGVRGNRRRLHIVVAGVVGLGLLAVWGYFQFGDDRLGDSLLVAASDETEPVGSAGDAADDPAIWVHPSDPSLSLLLGTDKRGGLHVYDLSGNEIQRFENEDQNNVDLRHGFRIRNQETTLVVTSSYEKDRLLFYRLDAKTRRLDPLRKSTLELAVEPSGVCMYRSNATGKFYAFVTGEDAKDELQDGLVEQWELRWDQDSKQVSALLVRRFDVGERIEGCVADDVHGYFYVSEENHGVWRYSAEPEGGAERVSLDRVQPEGRIRAHCEGIAIYGGADGAGYVIVSSQSSNDFCVYDRRAPHGYVGRFGLVAGAGTDEVTHTDGIEVSATPFGDAYPRGLFIAQDDVNDDGNQNFKLASWATIEAALVRGP